MSKNKKVKNVSGNKEEVLTGEQVLKLLPESEMTRKVVVNSMNGGGS